MHLQVVDGGAGTIDIRTVGQCDGGSFDRETLHNVLRDGIQQLHYVVARKKLLTEFVKTFGLATSLVGALRFTAGSLGQLAGDDRGDQKSKQGDPILRISDGQGADRRKKIIVEGQS